MSRLAPWAETPRGKRRVDAICLIITVGVKCVFPIELLKYWIVHT